VLFENSNLCFGALVLATRAFNSSPRLFFARAKLLIVEHCKICPALTLSPLANGRLRVSDRWSFDRDG